MCNRNSIISAFGNLTEYDAEGYMAFGAVRVALVITAKAMEIILLELILIFRLKEAQLVSNRVYAGLVCVVGTTFISQNYLRNIIYQETYTRNSQSEAMVVACSVVVIDIIVYIICMRLMESNAELIKERMKIAAYEGKIKDIEYAQELNMQTKKIRHDMKNELLKIRIKLNDNEYAGAEKYLDEMLNIKLAQKDIVYTGNMLVETIINKGIELCKQTEIKINVDVLCSIEGVDEMDFAILISNLIDNAIEAAMRTSEKYVNMLIKHVNGNLYINVKNSYNEKDARNYREGTTKEDKVYHGYGLLNVRDIVKKYKGQYFVECSDGIYNTEVVLNMTEMTA